MNAVNSNLRIRGRNPRGEGERLRATLLEAAIALVAENEDPGAVSVRAVTARAGVSPTALYLHFDGREELFRAVSEECFGELRAALEAAEADAGPDPRGRLVAAGHAYLRFARERPGHYAVLFQRHLTEPDPEDESKVGMEVFEMLVEAIARNGVPAEGAFDEAVLAWMSLHGRASVASAMPGFPFPDEDRFVELLVARALGEPRPDGGGRAAP